MIENLDKGNVLKVLLVGGTGVLSGAVATEAYRKGIHITVITRGNRPVPTEYTSIVCDRNDYTHLSGLLEERYDAVIDFLCYTEAELEQSFKFYSQYTHQYFFISSCAVYDSRTGVCDEESPKVLPMWKYSVDKWAAEQKLALLAKSTNCNYTIIRPCVTYDDTRIPYGISPRYGYHWTICARILAEKPIITWNNGANRCNMMRVEDFAVGMVGLIGNAKAYNEAFNICGDETPSFREVLSIVEEYLHKKAITLDMPSEFYAEQIPYRAGELLGGRAIDAIICNAKIKSVVPGFAQTISISDGIRKTLDAYKNQRFQRGIDWGFDAETDRAIRNWCVVNHIPDRKYNLCFNNYIGTASLSERLMYFKILYSGSMLMKVFHKGQAWLKNHQHSSLNRK